MIPTWIEQKVSDQLIAEVIRNIKKHHYGQTNAAKKQQLMQEIFNISVKGTEYDNKERLLRRCIELANTQHQALIVSDTEHGYWWAASLQDGLEPAEKNMDRAKTIMHNAKAVLDNIKSEYGGQMGLL